MVEIEDPDANYDFEDEKQGNGKTKVVVLTLFLIFVILILYLAKNNFSLDILKTTVVPTVFVCDPLYQYNQNDSKTIMFENVNKSLEGNLPALKKLEEFQEGLIDFGNPLDNGTFKPKIILYFKGSELSGNNMPDSMCGFQVEVKHE